MIILIISLLIFFFNAIATTYIYTLSLHDALPISRFLDPEGLPDECPIAAHVRQLGAPRWSSLRLPAPPWPAAREGDRKSTRLNSSHANISYAVFCLKKKTTISIPAKQYERGWIRF